MATACVGTNRSQNGGGGRTKFPPVDVAFLNREPRRNGNEKSIHRTAGVNVVSRNREGTVKRIERLQSLCRPTYRGDFG